MKIALPKTWHLSDQLRYMQALKDERERNQPEHKEVLAMETIDTDQRVSTYDGDDEDYKSYKYYDLFSDELEIDNAARYDNVVTSAFY